MINQYDLIIFDCDGTLVNTEELSNKVHSEGLTAFGLAEYTPEKCLIEFTGSSWIDIKRKLENKHSLEIPDSLFHDYIEAMLKHAETENIEVEGALDFVNKVSATQVKIGVASNGMRVNVIKTLKITGFMDYFSQETVLTKQDVKNPKPSPEMYLLAASKQGVAPSKCLVIEDSPTGAMAGIAAGMDVFGFTGTAHDSKSQAEKLQKVGVKAVYNDFIHMAKALGV